MDTERLSQAVRWASAQGWLRPEQLEAARRSAGAGVDPLTALLQVLSPQQGSALLARFDAAPRHSVDEDTLKTIKASGSTTYASPEKPGPGSGSAAGRFPGYRVVRELARGGMGAVLLARSEELDRSVAIKVLLKDGPSTTAKELERFSQEARVAAQLQHPNIVRIHHVGRSRGEPFIVMDFVEGQTLDRRVREEGPLEPREAAEIVGVLAEALAFAHARGVLHRDIKPANVMVGPTGPVIMDFGLAKNIDAPAEDGLTLPGEVLGTPEYMPPEQAGGEHDRIDVRADIYALGATLYCLLTGEAPFRGATTIEIIKKVLFKEPAPPAGLEQRISADLETICLKCLAKEPVYRYQTAHELAEDLRRFLSDEPILARRPNVLERVARLARRHRRAALAIGLALVVVLASGGALGDRLLAARREAKAQEENARRAGLALSETEERRESERRAREEKLRQELERLAAGEVTLAGLEAAVTRLVKLSDAETLPLLIAPLERLNGRLRDLRARGHLRALKLPSSGPAGRGIDLRALERGLEKLAAGGSLSAEEGRAVRETRGLLRGARGALRSVCPSDIRASAWIAQAQVLEAGEEILLLALCRALGRSEPSPEADRALRAHLAVDEDPRRALASARALLALRSEAGLITVARALTSFGEFSGFGTPLNRQLRGAAEELSDLETRCKRPEDLYFLHDMFLQLDELGRALRAITLAVALEPERSYWRARRAFTLFKLGRRAEAKALIEEVLRQRPDRAQALVIASTMAVLSGDLGGGQRFAQSAVDLAPRWAEAWQQRGAARDAGRDFAPAFGDYSQALALDPGLVTARLKRARVLYYLQRFPAALLDIEQVLEIRPEDSLSRWTRGEVLLKLGQPARALADFDRVLARDPGFPVSRPARIVALNELGRRQAALKAARAMLAAKNPIGPEGAVEIARALVLGGQDREAKGILDQLRAAEGGAQLWRCAELNLTLGRLDEAEGDARAAVKARPKSARSQLSLAKVLRRRGDHAGAWRILEVMSRDPGLRLEADILLLAARAARSAGAPARAQSILQFAVLYSNHRADLWAESADLMVERSRPADALDLINEAMLRDVEVPRYHLIRGAAMEKLRRLPEALESYGRALTLDPDFAEALIARGLLRLSRAPRGLGAKAGSAEARRALTDLERGLRLKPEDPRAAEIRRMIKDPGRGPRR